MDFIRESFDPSTKSQSLWSRRQSSVRKKRWRPMHIYLQFVAHENTDKKVLKSSNLACTMLLSQRQILQEQGFPCT